MQNLIYAEIFLKPWKKVTTYFQLKQQGILRRYKDHFPFFRNCGLEHRLDLISLLRFYDVSTRISTKKVAQKQFHEKQSENEDEMYLLVNDPMITAQKQFDPEELLTLRA